MMALVDCTRRADIHLINLSPILASTQMDYECVATKGVDANPRDSAAEPGACFSIFLLARGEEQRVGASS